MLAEKPWKLDAVLRLFLGVITVLCLGAGLGGLVQHFTASWPKGQTDFWLLVISAAFMEIPALILIAFFLRQHNITWKDAFGFHTTEPATAVAYGVLAGALFVPAGWALESLSGYLMELVHLNAKDQQIIEELQDPTLNLPEKAVLGMIVVFIAPLAEEMLFRGLLYPALKQLGRPRMALWASSALFALVHFNVETFMPLLIFALVLVRLYETFQNLLAPVVAHALFNAANFMTLIFQDKIVHWMHPT